jgi:hypothetical protein
MHKRRCRRYCRSPEPSNGHSKLICECQRSVQGIDSAQFGFYAPRRQNGRPSLVLVFLNGAFRSDVANTRESIAKRVVPLICVLQIDEFC